MTGQRRYLFLLIFCLIPSLAVAKFSYKKELKKETRHADHYRKGDMMAALIWTATRLTDDTLAAQAAQYKKKYDVSDSEESAFLDELTTKRKGELTFFISFYSSDARYPSLNDEKAKWDLRLEVGDERIKPSRIDEMGKTTTYDLLFYPYISSWSRGYWVSFPMPASAEGEMSLVIHGPEAKSRLNWD